MDSVIEQKSFKLFSILLLLSFMFHFAAMFKDITWEIPKISDIADEKPLVIKIKNNFKEANQIVRTDKSKNQTPSAADYLSEQNNFFDRETTAKDIGKFKRAGIGVKNGVDQITKEQQKKSGANTKKVASLKDLSVSPKMDFGEFEKERQQRLSPKGLSIGDANQKGLSANNDYLDEVPLGDFTQLNTQEFKHFGFYNRIRERLESFWGTSVKEKSDELFRSGRRFPASENYITSLVIKIDEKGVIKDVKIKSSSGVRELDEAATESFNKAGPFPNPPRELVKDGSATIEWGFVVKS